MLSSSRLYKNECIKFICEQKTRNRIWVRQREQSRFLLETIFFTMILFKVFIIFGRRMNGSNPLSISLKMNLSFLFLKYDFNKTTNISQRFKVTLVQDERKKKQRKTNRSAFDKQSDDNKQMTRDWKHIAR